MQLNSINKLQNLFKIFHSLLLIPIVNFVNFSLRSIRGRSILNCLPWDYLSRLHQIFLCNLFSHFVITYTITIAFFSHSNNQRNTGSSVTKTVNKCKNLEQYRKRKEFISCVVDPLSVVKISLDKEHLHERLARKTSCKYKMLYVL